MELNIQDRLILLNVLPKEGDFTTLKILRDLQSALSFNEKELAALKIESVEGQGTRWDLTAANELSRVEIPIGGRANAMIVDAFQKLSEAKKLTFDHLGTFEKFVTD